MNTAKLENIFTDDYVAQLMKMETVEQVQASFKEKGLDLSQDEIKQIINQVAQGDKEELSDDQLENVTGGLFFTAIITAIILEKTGVLKTKSDVNPTISKLRW